MGVSGGGSSPGVVVAVGAVAVAPGMEGPVRAETHPPKVDLPTEQRRVRGQSLIASLVCGVFLVAMSLGLPVWMVFPIATAERFELVLRADVVVALWVVVGVRMIGKIRFESKDDNAGSAFGPPSPRLRVPAAFLQNTLEQAFIAVIAHLALSTIEGEAPLAYVLASVALFCLGRAAFLIGYPKGAGGRAFGMVTTALPTIGAYAWVIVVIVVELVGAIR